MLTEKLVHLFSDLVGFKYIEVLRHIGNTPLIHYDDEVERWEQAARKVVNNGQVYGRTHQLPPLIEPEAGAPAPSEKPH